MAGRRAFSVAAGRAVGLLYQGEKTDGGFISYDIGNIQAEGKQNTTVAAAIVYVVHAEERGSAVRVPM